MEKVLPYQQGSGSKKEQVAAMFDNISRKYDFLNHFLSLGIDKLWRKRAIKELRLHADQTKVLLDVATGTGDFAIEALRLNPDKIIGVDISEGMLEMGRKKIADMSKEQVISLQKGDSENLEFEEGFFDGATVAFGVRNFENLQLGIDNIYRVLAPKGALVVLEFSKPKATPLRQLYNFYFNNILPFIGNTISRDKSAYTYLPESVKAFPDGDLFLEILRASGFRDVKCIPLTFGICSIYIGIK